MKDIGTMRITIPATPPSINTYLHKHWRVKKDIKEEWIKMIWGRLPANHPRNCKHVHIKATITFPIKRTRDAQNYAATLFKFLDDALKVAHVIPDDTAEFISHSEPVLRVGDKAETVIEIREE